ncbi:M43 family zinc metalloprotease [Chryseotalea sanaruensis]|uniref:M43 family zinc metalloprotease n=1 Tax=Chryseotalea sanaruensis TaxID=2482724 RepID=UPI000F8EF9CA|nr:M43 family zinc metalloprotease [Chryseotalea sanaruensis]
MSLNLRCFSISLLCLLWSAFLPSGKLQAQIRCATTEQTNALFERIQKQERREIFEKAIRDKSINRLQPNGKQRTHAGPYQIPVVVHIIHNGEPVGIGTNIPDEQVFSQIRVLNDDFKRLNNDANLTPAEFLPLAGGLDIEFVLARQSPDGQPSNGIVRKKGSKSGYIFEEEVLLKSESIWPTEDYLNIWVCRMTDDVVGYAQFPISDLQGLEEYQNEIASTDGVAIAHDAFGSIEDGNFNLLSRFNRGRTLTHEVGHYFGLRHIWGDDSNCNTTTDYVADTPKQNNDTSGCPTHPQVSCSNTKMFQNFMDYTNDVCMNLFTAGQVDRMEIILNDDNVPRRKSLLSSLGLIFPPGGLQNVALLDIISPWPVSCATENVLTIRFQNIGSDPLTFIQLSYQLNGGTVTNTQQIFDPIAPFNYGEISIPLLISEGTYDLSVTLNLPNGAEDSNPNDNTLTKSFIIDGIVDQMPTRERFEGFFNEKWTAINPEDGDNWILTSTFYNQSLVFQSLDFTQQSTAWLVSPNLDFSNLTEANLRFDWSHRTSPNNDVNGSILYSTDCGLNYLPLTSFIFEGTSNTTSVISEDNWDSQVINLNNLANEPSVRLAITARAYLDDPLYLDNIELYAGEASPKIPLTELVAIYPDQNGGLNLTFNVEERQTVVFSIYDITGKTLVKNIAVNTLNQTYTFPLSDVNTGIYVVHIKADNQYYSQKVFIEGR